MTDERPSGQVTFLFTDLEGSTRLWERRPAVMPAVYTRHDAIIRAATVSYRGVVYKVIGDAFQIAFTRPADALSAAIEAQRALLAEPWPVSPPPRVRMAIHVCDVAPQPDGDYRTAGLNRLGRLLTAADGGQLLLTEAAARGVAEQGHMPLDATLHDLGLHRFRDLTPQRVYQALAQGLPAETASLRALAPHRHNLPRLMTVFVGREDEIRRGQTALVDPTCRVLTLRGPGGVGKTRLAIEMAFSLVDHFPGGVWFVLLASVTDPGLVLPVIAATLGVRESVDQSTLDALASHFAGNRTLLVLDNLEQVLDAAADIAALAASCPLLSLLITSRVPLAIAGEHEFPVPPLPIGEPSKTGSVLDLQDMNAESDAVRLFADRVKLVRPDFTLTAANSGAVTAICARLDGLPLAIELAAARGRLLSPEQLLMRLEERLPFLTGGPRDLPARQQTLRGAIEWSHDLLTRPEQELFQRLSVFVGGASLEAIETICQDDNGSGASDLFAPLESLVRQSLLVVDDAASLPRVSMLETIREYASERLAAAGETAEWTSRHAAWFRDLAERAAPHLTGSLQADWLDTLAIDHDNLRRALDTLAVTGQSEELVAATGALWRFWWIRGHLAEGRERLERAIAVAEVAPVAPQVLARALDGAGALAEAQGDVDRAAAFHERALELWEEAGDALGQAGSLANLGIIELHDRGHAARARDLHEAVLAAYRAAGDRQGIASALKHLGDVALTAEEFAASSGLYTEALAIARDIGDTRGVAVTLTSLGALAFLRGEHDRAISLYEESLTHWRALDDVPGTALVLGNLGEALHHAGDSARAKPLYEESLAMSRELGDRQGIAFAQSHLARIARQEGQVDLAVALLAESARICLEIGDPVRLAECLEGLAGASAELGDAEDAARLFGLARRVRDDARAERPAVHAPDYERDLNATRALLDDATFAARFTSGLGTDPKSFGPALAARAARWPDERRGEQISGDSEATARYRR